MGTDHTVQIESSPEVLRAISSGPDGDALVGSNSQGNRYELRVLRAGESALATIDRVSRQLALIELAEHPAIRAVSQSLSDSNPQSFALALPPGVDPIADRLDHIIDSLNDNQRVEVAVQLADAVSAAHRVGLCHGLFSASTVLVDRRAEILSVFVDFSSTSFAENVTAEPLDNQPLSVEQDLAALRTLLQLLLLPVVEASRDSDGVLQLGGRQRAMLRQWLVNEDQLPPTLKQWQSVLNRVPQDARETTIDQTGIVNAQPLVAGSDSTSNLANGQASSNLETAAIPEKLGRFQIVEKIGEGGMGAVYRATDSSNGQTVALKVLSSNGEDHGHSIRRFRKEARLLADAQNEHVTRLIDVCEDQGVHFLAMEFIDGVNLKQWLAGRGPLPEPVALKIASDLARALVEAHSREVIHRDIKPENVMLKLRDDVIEGTVPPIERPIDDFTIKLTDFGIARHVNQSESMEVTVVGAILGTPKYMSPEQCKSSAEIGPAADIYSLGITLYQLLTGSVPFVSDDFMKLAAMHCFDAPPSVQKRMPSVSDITARIVDRSLSKSPADRYGDAGQLLAELLRTIRGEAVAIKAHPRLPQYDSNKMWEKTVSWDLESEPTDLWPLVSNTERLNEAIGLPAVNYRTENDPQMGVRKFGSFKLSGITVSWEEHPFEWIEGQRMGILREFDSGPLKWFMSVITLVSQPGGGTRLSHQVRIERRNWIGHAITKIEADWKGFKNLKRAYARMDRSIQNRRIHSLGDKNADQTKAGGFIDPYADPKPLSKQRLNCLNERIDNVIQNGATHDTGEALRRVLQNWAPQELSHLRPLNIADRMNVSGTEMIDTCLIAATEGLLNLRWDILCPACRVTASTTNLLSDIESHTHCEACDVDFKSNLGDAIEMVFRAHPEIREVNDGQYCIGGPEHSPHVIAQVRMEPGEYLDLTMNLAEGEYLVRGPRLPQSGRIRVQSSSAPSNADFTLSKLGSIHIPKLRMGQQTIGLMNDLDSLHVVRLERTIPRDDVVTAAMATANPAFRRLFPHQNFAVDTPIETETISFLATAVANIDDLYQSFGDAEAYKLILRHHQLICEAVVASGGTVVKSIGDRMLANFPRREQTIDAAAGLRQRLAEELQESIQLGIGVHSGPTLVTTQNNQLDYFGGTVRAALSLPEHAGPDTLVTEAIYSDVSVRGQHLQGHDRVEIINLPGTPNMRCKRIRSTAGDIS